MKRIQPVLAPEDEILGYGALYASAGLQELALYLKKLNVVKYNNYGNYVYWFSPLFLLILISSPL
jgi:hypothetical protein